MGQTNTRGRSRRLSLSVRLTLLVLFAALLPLAAVVGVNDYLARKTLVDQGRTALSTDAKAKVTLIDTYMRERLLDGQALATLPTAIAYLTCVTAPPGAAPAQLACDTLGTTYKDSSARALAVGIVRDSNYSLWNIYDVKGKLLLTSSPDGARAKPAVPAEDLEPVAQGKQRVSGVYYDPSSKRAFVRLYTPITPKPGQAQPVLGFLQATLNLDYIWNIVNGEQGANGKGSSAFITDENGIRVADANADNLFTAVEPLDAATQQQIASEQRFGGTSITQVRLPQVQASLATDDEEQRFEGIATPGSDTLYQFVRIRMSTVPWTYFVLSPDSTVTQVADAQVRISLLSAGVIAVLAVLIGLFFGRRTASPVQSSVGELQGAALALKSLASRQESSASEQHWVVDACRTGLDSIRYLSDAMNQAARRIIDASNWFSEYWDRLTEEQARRTVQHLVELAHYIDEAARRQQASNDRMDKAITVTMQVSDQLVSGAAAATQSADQLEQVVQDLQHVVGGRQQPSGMMGEMAPAAPSMAMVPAGTAAPHPMYADQYAPQSPYGQQAQYGQQQYNPMRAPSAPRRAPQSVRNAPSRNSPSRFNRNSSYGSELGNLYPDRAGEQGGYPQGNPPSRFGGRSQFGSPSRVMGDEWGAPAPAERRGGNWGER